MGWDGAGRNGIGWIKVGRVKHNTTAKKMITKTAKPQNNIQPPPPHKTQARVLHPPSPTFNDNNPSMSDHAWSLVPSSNFRANSAPLPISFGTCFGCTGSGCSTHSVSGSNSGQLMRRRLSLCTGNASGALGWHSVVWKKLSSDMRNLAKYAFVFFVRLYVFGGGKRRARGGGGWGWGKRGTWGRGEENREGGDRESAYMRRRGTRRETTRLERKIIQGIGGRGRIHGARECFSHAQNHVIVYAFMLQINVMYRAFSARLYTRDCTRQGEARRGEARRGEARQGYTRRGEARRGVTRGSFDRRQGSEFFHRAGRRSMFIWQKQKLRKPRRKERGVSCKWVPYPMD